MEPRIIPDHNILRWSVNLPAQVSPGNTSVKSVTITKYDVTTVPDDLLSDPDVLSKLNQGIQRIENVVNQQNDLNVIYEDFCEVVTSQMNEKLNVRVIQIRNGLSSKRRKVKKPWWNPNLDVLWQRWAQAEDKIKGSHGRQRQMRRSEARARRKEFDKANQAAKRKHWREMQDLILELQTDNPKEYWQYVGKIGVGKQRSSHIPWEVIDKDGNTVVEHDEVLDEWKMAFEGLLNPDGAATPEQMPETPNPQQNPPDDSSSLDEQISVREVRKALAKAKNGKAVGFDSIPVEVIRNEQAISFLHKLFNACFQLGRVPDIWNRGIINPIPKSSALDPRVPLNYRGITMASSIYKLYCGILNSRLCVWSEANKKLVDAQNGFRKGRGCVDHLETVAEIINTRKQKKLSTFISFVDFSKAYDFVNRDMLWWKLQKLGIAPKFLLALKSLYQNVQCCVCLNGWMSDWFHVKAGLKQGCLVSPILFSLYINDLAEEINALDVGVKCEEETVAILLFADDIILMAETEDDLQLLLNKLSSWCEKWQMKINAKKTQIIHFRPNSVQRTEYTFMCGMQSLSVVDRYRYLGLMLNEHMNMQETAKVVSQAASRALGVLIHKYKSHGGLPFAVYSKLYDGLVQPILDYGAIVWGTQEFSFIKAIQHRAGRVFLGVGKSAPTTAVLGDLGWTCPSLRQWMAVLRHWCRLSAMSADRLNQRIFAWSRRNALSGVKNNSQRVIAFLRKVNCDQLIDCEILLNDMKQIVKQLKADLEIHFVEMWHLDLERDNAKYGAGKNKLRTYRLFKSAYKSEPYVRKVLNRKHRSAFARLRCGVAPIRLETGRFERIPEEERLCPVCDSGEIENEIHVITSCSLYDDLRNDLYQYASTINEDFINLSDCDKLVFIFANENMVNITAKICHSILNERFKATHN